MLRLPSPISWVGKLMRQPVRNCYNQSPTETIPPYSIVELIESDGNLGDKNKQYWTVKPITSNWSPTRRYAATGYYAIYPESYGYCTVDFPAPVAYEPVTGFVNGDICGPIGNSFKLQRNLLGFRRIGLFDGATNLILVSEERYPILRVRLNEALVTGATALSTITMWNGSSYDDGIVISVTEDLGLGSNSPVASGSIGRATFDPFRKQYVFTAIACPP